MILNESQKVLEIIDLKYKYAEQQLKLKYSGVELEDMMEVFYLSKENTMRNFYKRYPLEVN